MGELVEVRSGEGMGGWAVVGAEVEEEVGRIVED